MLEATAPAGYMPKCPICNREFSYASGLSRHKKSHEIPAPEPVIGLMARTTAAECGHIVHLSAIGQEEWPGSGFPDYSSVYSIEESQFNAGEIDTIEFIRILLDRGGSEADHEVDHEVDLCIKIGAFECRIPHNVLAALNCFHPTSIEIPHKEIFPQLLPVNRMNISVTLVPKGGEPATNHRVLIRKTIHGELTDFRKRTREGRLTKHHLPVRVFNDLAFDGATKANYTILDSGRLAGIMYRGSVKRLSILLNGYVRFDYDQEMLDFVAEDLGESKYLNIQGLPFRSAYDHSTLNIGRIDKLTVIVETDGPAVLTFDRRVHGHFSYGNYPYGMAGYGDGLVLDPCDLSLSCGLHPTLELWREPAPTPEN